MRKGVLLAWSVAALSAATALAPAAALADDVTVTGCPEPGITAGCIVVLGAGGVYDISAAKPSPMIGVAGKATGTVIAPSDTTSASSLCGQSNTLSPVTWVPMAGMSCPDRWLG